MYLGLVMLVVPIGHVMLVFVGGASICLCHVVTCGWGQCILDSAYWSCCYLCWCRASVSWTVPIGHVVTCGQGQCMLGASVSWIVPIGHVGICA